MSLEKQKRDTISPGSRQWNKVIREPTPAKVIEDVLPEIPKKQHMSILTVVRLPIKFIPDVS
jgi:hypothetical protein